MLQQQAYHRKMKAYSIDLRTKLVESVRRRGVSISETARRFGINRSTLARYLTAPCGDVAPPIDGTWGCSLRRPPKEDRGHPQAHVRLSKATWANIIATRYKQLDEEGSLIPKKPPGSPPKLHHSAMRLLEEFIKARPWATHKQRSEFLFAACGVEVSEATVCRAIKEHFSYSRKKDQQEPLRETSGSAWCGILCSVSSTASGWCL